MYSNPGLNGPNRQLFNCHHKGRYFEAQSGTVADNLILVDLSLRERAIILAHGPHERSTQTSSSSEEGCNKQQTTAIGH